MISLINFFNKISPISDEAVKSIHSICEFKNIKKNEILHSIGHRYKEIYFIQKGLARIYYIREGREITENLVPAGNMLTNPESLLTGNYSKKIIQMVEDSNVIMMNVEKLHALFDVHPDLERLFRKICEAAYIQTLIRLENMQFSSAHQRYTSILNEHPELVQKVPLKHLASYLGITPVSLSRIRSKK